MDLLARRANSAAAAPTVSRRASSRASAPAAASAASLPAAGSGVSGSRTCSAEASAAARKQTNALAEENAQLRKEVAEAREQLAKIMYTHPDAPPVAGAAPPDAAWAAAQLTQAQRQVELLTEALVQRGELSTEVEAALIKLRQPTADGKRPEYADWATNTLRRIRHVQFVEELASEKLAAQPKPRAATGPRPAGRGAGRGGGSQS